MSNVEGFKFASLSNSASIAVSTQNLSLFGWVAKGPRANAYRSPRHNLTGVTKRYFR